MSIINRIDADKNDLGRNHDDCDDNDHDDGDDDADDGEADDDVFLRKAMERLIIVNRIDDAHVNRRQWIELAINIKKGKRR